MIPARYSRIAAYTAGLALFAWFAYLIRGGLTSWFDNDDLMNLHYYWSRPWPALLKANLCFWSSYYRPGGGLFYRVIFAIWGFHPLPFHIASFILLCLDFALLAVVVYRLTGSRWGTLLALLVLGIHPAFVDAYLSTGTIYDVLAYAFFWAAFAWYVRQRQAGRLPGAAATVLLLCLFAAALDSKEIAVLWPVAVALYEVVWHPPADWKPAGLWRWIRREGRLAAIGAIFDLAFIIGKRYGPDSLWQVEAYRPHYSLGAYIGSLSSYLHEFVDRLDLKPLQMVALIVAMAVVAAVSRRRCLIWSVGFILAGILPLAFIPGRGGFAYLVPAVGWAVYVAGLGDWLLELATGKYAWVRAAAQILILAVLARQLSGWQRRVIGEHTAAAHNMQHRFLRYEQQIRALIPAPAKGARILLLTDADGYHDWDVYFLIRLMYGDPQLQAERMTVWRENHVQVDPRKYPYVLDYANGAFNLVSPVSGPPS
ncbi:MAG TPA: hypothetical protein VMI94_03035 [Bryobacteraceae bacterium]|nr:hypothetical protein [Bryobacteraceae bacterium]